MQKKEKTIVRLKPVTRSTPPALNASEFNWPTANDANRSSKIHGGREKTVVNELIGALKDIPSSTIQAKLGNLKKHLSTAYDRQPKALRAPLPDRERERFERDAAYRQVSTEVGDWDEIVRKNRLADKLVFPLFTEPFKLQTIEEKIEQFEPRTKLEIEMANTLSKSKHNLKNSDTLTEAEKEALKSMSLEEAKLRRAQLQKMRALVSYAERKLRWQNRIKSKRYRRLLKKQDRKKVEKEFQELLDKDPTAALEKLEMLERDRIKERATLKHRSTGKWAKQVRHLAKKDPRLREALQEQLRKGRELAEKKRVDVALEEDDSEQEDEAAAENEGETGDGAEKVQSEKWKQAQPMLQLTSKLIEAGNGEDDDETSNQALMAEAFAEDDVMEDFRAELEADIDKEDKDAVESLEAQLTLPGWNSWTGPGTEKLKANRERRDRLEKLKSKRDKEKRRRLKKWPLVKINDSVANESVKKLQVSDLPFPFSSTRDFEANLEQPLGKEWNPETVHQSLIQPSVETRMGTVIKPMDREVALRKKAVDKPKRRRRPLKRNRRREKDGKDGDEATVKAGDAES